MQHPKYNENLAKFRRRKLNKVAFGIACLACAGGAHASVTLYGLIDAGITYTNNQKGSSNFQTASSIMQGDAWGLRITEDLGGGLSTIAVLESGFVLFDGTSMQGGREFGRQAYVGLTNPWGTLTFGRQYDLVADFVIPVSSVPYLGVYSGHLADNDNLQHTFRENNAVKYTSPNYRGFSFGTVYAFGNQPGEFANNRAWNVGAGYKNGPFSIAAAYERLSGPAGNTTGAVGASGTSGSDYPSLPALFETGTVTGQQIAVASGNYQIGKFTAGASYSHVRFDVTTSPINVDNFEIFGTFAATPSLFLTTALAQTNVKIVDTGTKPKYRQLSAAIDYFLSKRTDVYTLASFQHALGDAQVANLYSLPASSTKNQVAVRIGLRHKF
jgi:GBP family porin